MDAQQRAIATAPKYPRKALVEFQTTSCRGMTDIREGRVLGLIATKGRGWWVAIEVPGVKGFVKARPGLVKLLHLDKLGQRIPAPI